MARKLSGVANIGIGKNQNLRAAVFKDHMYKGKIYKKLTTWT
jgi:hypothetical protein